MGDSLSSWLALRESADTAARSATLTRAIADALPRDGPLYVLDLATGTGSNVRYLAERLPSPQHWLVVDQDPALLAEVPVRMSSWGTARGCEAIRQADGLLLRGARLECHIEARRLDLGMLDDPGLFSGRHLVTASALLDLVSETWLSALAARCRLSGAAGLFALTYNGHSRCSPVEPEDDTIRDLMNRHQKANNKGFGVAAGPDAADCAARCFADVGYYVEREASDWVLQPESGELQRQLIEGWAEAAGDIAPAQSPMIQSWRTRRLAHVEGSRSRLIVNHEDLAAWPATSSISASRGR